MMPKFTAFGWYWVAWIFIGFGVPEAYWLVRNHLNTLSDQFWGLEHLDLGHPFDFAEWTPLHYILGVVLITFFLWLFLHLTFGLIR